MEQKSEYQDKSKKNIQWITHMDVGLAHAKQKNKPVMIDFMATWCPPCQRMEDSTFSHLQVIEKSRAFIPVRIDVDRQPDVAQKYNGNARKYGGIGIPNILFLSRDGARLKHIIGYYKPHDLIAVMDSVLSDITNTDLK